MLSDTSLIPDTKILDFLLTVGSLGAHQLFQLTPNSSTPHLKSEGSVHLYQMTVDMSGLAALKKTSRITLLIYTFQKPVRDHNEGNQALEQRSYGLSILGGFESPMGWSSNLIDDPSLSRRQKKFLQSFPIWVYPMTSWSYCAKHSQQNWKWILNLKMSQILQYDSVKIMSHWKKQK